MSRRCNGLTFVTLTNTIVAEQVAGGDIFLFQPTNVIGSYDVFSTAVSTSTTHSIVADPMLAPLGDYGGPTETMALLPGSPAIDAGVTGDGHPDDRPARHGPRRPARHRGLRGLRRHQPRRRRLPVPHDGGSRPGLHRHGT